MNIKYTKQVIHFTSNYVITFLQIVSKNSYSSSFFNSVSFFKKCKCVKNRYESCGPRTITLYKHLKKYNFL